MYFTWDAVHQKFHQYKVKKIQSHLYAFHVLCSGECSINSLGGQICQEP